MNLGMSVAASVSLSIKWGWSPLPPVVDVGVTGQNAHELFCIVVWHMVGKNLKDFGLKTIIKGLSLSSRSLQPQKEGRVMGT